MTRIELTSYGVMRVQYSSDVISTSAPGVPANHAITFQLADGVPAGGHIIVAFEPGWFDIPADLNFEDIDLATSTALSGPWEPRSLASFPDANNDGVSVASGTQGWVDVTLGQGISSSTFVQLLIGTNAMVGATGTRQIMNPTSTGPYHIRIRTKNASGALINEGDAMVFLLAQVETHVDTSDFAPPILSNGLPSGTIPAGIRYVEISLNTDELAWCRYATSSDVTYLNMKNNFTYTGDWVQRTVVDTPQDNANYTFYVRCKDRIPNYNTSDFVISFTLKSPSLPPGPGGSSAATAASNPPFPPVMPTGITMSGRAYPSAAVTILKDGAIYKEASADTLGDFMATGAEIPQGTYTFSAYAKDTANRRSSAYASTLTVVRGTSNAITGILIPPTIALEDNSINPGETASVAGTAQSNSKVEVQIKPQKAGTIPESEIITEKVTAAASGEWSVLMDTSRLTAGVYEVNARANVANVGVSPWSQSTYLGVGKSPGQDSCRRADMNRDGKVNLVDFSILLYNWGSSKPVADLNGDGKVNLVDFSMLLFCWTG